MTNANKERIDVWIDTIPNLLKAQDNEDKVKEALLKGYERGLDHFVTRYKELPPLFVKREKYLNPLVEARQLYVEGYFYSCVAMCGITSERIAKDILQNNIGFKREEEFISPSGDLIKYLDRIDMETIRELLIKSGVLDEQLRNPFKKLAKLRNLYAHSGGKDMKGDAKTTIIDLIERFYDNRLRNSFAHSSYFLHENFYSDTSDKTFEINQTNTLNIQKELFPKLRLAVDYFQTYLNVLDNHKRSYTQNKFIKMENKILPKNRGEIVSVFIIANPDTGLKTMFINFWEEIKDG